MILNWLLGECYIQIDAINSNFENFESALCKISAYAFQVFRQHSVIIKLYF